MARDAVAECHRAHGRQAAPGLDPAKRIAATLDHPGGNVGPQLARIRSGRSTSPGTGRGGSAARRRRRTACRSGGRRRRSGRRSGRRSASAPTWGRDIEARRLTQHRVDRRTNLGGRLFPIRRARDRGPASREQVGRGADGIAARIDLFAGILEPLRVAPFEHQLVVPRRRRAPELDVEPVERGLDVVRPVEPGHAQQADPVGLLQEAEHLARRVVDLLVTPGVGHLVVEPVLDQDGARRDHRDDQVPVDGQAVFLAGEEPEARMKPDRETARGGLDAFAHPVLAAEAPRRDAADPGAARDDGRDALIERGGDEGHLAGA